jgi:hypothetical protein
MLTKEKEMKEKRFAVIWKKAVIKDYGMKKVEVTQPGAEFWDGTGDDNRIELPVLAIFPRKSDAARFRAGNSDWKIVPCTVEFDDA